MRWILVLALAFLFFIPAIYEASAQSCPANYVWNNSTERCITCWELGQCAFTQDPLGTMLLPLESIFSGLTIVILWGLLISILWVRTQNPMLVSVVGVAMTASYMTVAPQTSSEFDGARIIGGTLFAVSLGIGIYHMVQSRIYQPPQ